MEHANGREWEERLITACQHIGLIAVDGGVRSFVAILDMLLAVVEKVVEIQLKSGLKQRRTG